MSEETFDPLEGKEADEQQTPVIPIDGKAAQKDRDNRKKLLILSDQVRAHAKAKLLQCFIFTEGEKPGTVSISGHYSAQMIKSLVINLALKHPEFFSEAVEEMNKMAAQTEEVPPTIQTETYGEPRSEEGEKSGSENTGATIP